MVDWRSHSIADLAQEAHASIHFSTRYSCRAWLRSCAALQDQASSYRRTQEVGRERRDRNQEWEATEKEFVCWARCASILLELLPTHPQFRDGLTADEKATIRAQGHSSLDQLSKLKPILSDRYERYRIQAASAQREASSADRGGGGAAAADPALEDRLRSLQIAYPSSSSSASWQDDDSQWTLQPKPRYSTSIAGPNAPTSVPRHAHSQSATYPANPPPPLISYPTLDPRSSLPARSAPLHPALSARSTPEPSRPPTRDRSPLHPPAPPTTTTNATTAPPSWAGLRTMNVPPSLVSDFLKRAQKNTKRKVETCGLLLGTLDMGVFTVRVLLIPVQKGTSDTCETLEEEKVFDFQDKRGLLTLGWIHTHPTQSCFMSSLDLHTHSGYQCMLPEAIAIVCAPLAQPDLGIFRLTDPPGLGLIMACTRGETFHPHPDVKGGIYTGGFGVKDKGFGHVRMREGQGVEVVDLRK